MMANQAFGRADDILFGSGELFISLDGIYNYNRC